MKHSRRTVRGELLPHRFEPGRPGRWLLVPRGPQRASLPPLTLTAPPQFVWHYANAWEDAGGRVVVDACTYEEFDFGGFDLVRVHQIHCRANQHGAR